MMNGRVKIKVFHASFFMNTIACHHRIPSTHPSGIKMDIHEKTMHADLLLAGIIQLVTVLVASNIHQHQYIRSLKLLIA